MATVQQVPDLLEELADLVASLPTREQLLNYHPSEPIQQRARELLAKQNAGQAGGNDQDELAQFEWAEIFMRLVKSKLRERRTPRP
jgi:hypothetical protein